MNKIFASLLIVFSLCFGQQTNLNTPDLVKLPSTDIVQNAETASVSQTVGESGLILHFIDVGQADSILICLPKNQNMLVDAGNVTDGSTTVDYIKEQNISTIDYVVATHPHADHIGGMAEVIDYFNIGTIFMPDIVHTTNVFENLLTVIERKGLSISVAEAGKTIIDENDLTVKFIAPTTKTNDLNNMSAVIHISYGENSFLLMGDAEEESEREILSTTPIRVDLLKAGHHGSQTSSTPDFIRSVSPKYAVISVGRENPYGHPADAVLTTFINMGCEIYRTDMDGTIIATSDGKSITIKTISTVIQPNAPPLKEKNFSDERNPQINGSKVYITQSGSKFHKLGCRYLNKSKIEISLKEAQKHYTPCSICKPLQ